MTEASPDVREAAAERAQHALADLERLDMDSLSRLALSRRDVDARAPYRAQALEAARQAGLGTLLEEARVAARDYVIGAFDNAGFRTIGVDIAQTRSRASVDDRIAIVMAVEDALIAAVVDPFLGDDVRDVLATPFERLSPPHERAVAIPAAGPAPGIAIPTRTALLVLGGFVVVCVILAGLGFGIGLAGLAAAVAVVLVALVMRGRP